MGKKRGPVGDIPAGSVFGAEPAKKTKPAKAPSPPAPFQKGGGKGTSSAAVPEHAMVPFQQSPPAPARSPTPPPPAQIATCIPQDIVDF